MAIKAASTLEPNGTFALAKAKDIDVNGERLDAYLENISAGVCEKGDKGDPGVGISKVESAEVTGGVMVTITLDDGQASAFTLKNGEKGDTGSSAHVSIIKSVDGDGTKHAYVKTWEGEDDSAAEMSDDLMTPVNEVLAAVEEIMSSYTGTTEGVIQ